MTHVDLNKQVPIEQLEKILVESAKEIGLRTKTKESIDYEDYFISINPIKKEIRSHYVRISLKKPLYLFFTGVGTLFAEIMINRKKYNNSFSITDIGFSMSYYRYEKIIEKYLDVVSQKVNEFEDENERKIKKGI